MLRLPQLRAAAWLLVLAVISLSSGRAHAYAWMIKYGFSKCGNCHTDPAGGETLNSFGRVASQYLLSSGGADVQAPSSSAQYLFGAVHEPVDVNLGGSYRHMLLYTAGSPGVPGKFDQFPMQADLYGSAQIGAFVVGGSLGFADHIEGSAQARAAEINQQAGDGFMLLSRNHYLGLWLNDDTLLRFGRLNLPFGVRIPEHTMWAREATRTDRESDQQHGISLTYTGGRWRTDAMIILGNFQLNPDRFRERGAVASVEYLFQPTLALGASALLTRADEDALTRVKNAVRTVDGVTLRWGASRQFSLLSELDLLKDAGRKVGMTGFAQGDYEVLRGLHFMLTGEALDQGLLERADVVPVRGSGAPKYGAWLTLDWYFLPHFELRIDALARQDDVFHALAQLHIYL